MRRILRTAGVAVMLLLLWTIIAFFGTLQGWFHKPISEENSTASFISATDVELRKHFTGNFAMAILKNGKIEFEKFYSAGKPVDRNTMLWETGDVDTFLFPMLINKMLRMIVIGWVVIITAVVLIKRVTKHYPLSH